MCRRKSDPRGPYPHGSFRCPLDRVVRAAQEKAGYYRRRGRDAEAQVAYARWIEFSHRHEVLMAAGVDPGDEPQTPPPGAPRWKTAQLNPAVSHANYWAERQAAELALATELHDAIWEARQSKQPRLFKSDAEIAARVHARQTETRLKALEEPRLAPDVLRLAARFPDVNESAAAYARMALHPHLYETELTRSYKERREFQIGLETPIEEKAAWERAWYDLDAYLLVDHSEMREVA